MIKNRPNLRKAQERNKTAVLTIEDKVFIPPEMVGYGHNKKYLLQTYGCQANERDSENISGILELLGYEATTQAEDADLIIFNTCAIRENAENKVFGKIGSLKRLKKARPHLIIALCGCMPQEESTIAKLLASFQHVDLVFGTHNINNIPTLLAEALLSTATVIDVSSKEGEVIENLPSTRASSFKAWVNIMYGCDKFCTYCIVPYTRGKERSRHMENIIAEVEQLVAEGYQEITLLGQNVNAYGKDLKEGYDFSDLLAAVALTKIKRLRFMTSHPWDFTDQMIAVIAAHDNIMPFIHLPVQSGNDAILKLMNRRYTVAEYLVLFDKLKKAKPDVAMSTDIIVGFPGETRAAFNDTLKLVDYCQFDNAFTFAFSPRQGTPAAQMKDSVSDEEKKARLQILNSKVNHYFLKNNQHFMHQSVKVLVDGPSKKNKAVLSGYSEHNKLVNFKGSNELIGKIVNVKIVAVKSFSLEGELID